MTGPYSNFGGYWLHNGMLRIAMPGGWWKFKAVYRWHFYREETPR